MVATVSLFSLDSESVRPRHHGEKLERRVLMRTVNGGERFVTETHKWCAQCRVSVRENFWEQHIAKAHLPPKKPA